MVRIGQLHAVCATVAVLFLVMHFPTAMGDKRAALLSKLLKDFVSFRDTMSPLLQDTLNAYKHANVQIDKTRKNELTHREEQISQERNTYYNSLRKVLAKVNEPAEENEYARFDVGDMLKAEELVAINADYQQAKGSADFDVNTEQALVNELRSKYDQWAHSSSLALNAEMEALQAKLDTLTRINNQRQEMNTLLDEAETRLQNLVALRNAKDNEDYLAQLESQRAKAQEKYELADNCSELIRHTYLLLTNFESLSAVEKSKESVYLTIIVQERDQVKQLMGTLASKNVAPKKVSTMTKVGRKVVELVGGGKKSLNVLEQEVVTKVDKTLNELKKQNSFKKVLDAPAGVQQHQQQQQQQADEPAAMEEQAAAQIMEAEEQAAHQ